MKSQRKANLKCKKVHQLVEVLWCLIETVDVMFDKHIHLKWKNCPSNNSDSRRNSTNLLLISCRLVDIPHEIETLFDVSELQLLVRSDDLVGVSVELTKALEGVLMSMILNRDRVGGEHTPLVVSLVEEVKNKYRGGLCLTSKAVDSKSTAQGELGGSNPPPSATREDV
jgi:hypothetical protein